MSVKHFTSYQTSCKRGLDFMSVFCSASQIHAETGKVPDLNGATFHSLKTPKRPLRSLVSILMKKIKRQKEKKVHFYSHNSESLFGKLALIAF